MLTSHDQEYKNAHKVGLAFHQLSDLLFTYFYCLIAPTTNLVQNNQRRISISYQQIRVKADLNVNSLITNSSDFHGKNSETRQNRCAPLTHQVIQLSRHSIGSSRKTVWGVLKGSPISMTSHKSFWRHFLLLLPAAPKK